MKIRIGFITNSSSTNFLIISKQELTCEYLFKKLGFKKGSPIENEGLELCENIIRAVSYDSLRYHSCDISDYDSIKKVFGEKSAEIFSKKGGAFVYCGSTSSDDSPLTQFFTTDSFEIEDKDFYLNGRACVW